MRLKHLTYLAGLAVLLSPVACTRDKDDSLEKALVNIDQRLQKIETRLDSRGAPTRAGTRAPRRAQRPPGPDPKKVYSVPVAGSPYKGAEHAKVTVVQAYQFSCGYCEKVRPTLDKLLDDYAGDIKVVYRYLGSATPPAMAACAAQKQGKFEQMYTDIWDKAYKGKRDLSRDKMLALAVGLQLDIEKFKTDSESQACRTQVAKDQQVLRSFGARTTPNFFINGRFLSGARPIEFFKALIDEELKKANAAVARGVPVAEYYQREVLAKGLKRL